MNYEKLWFKLKQHINSKNSHGKNELLTAMMGLEIEENDNGQDTINHEGSNEPALAGFRFQGKQV